MSGPAHLRAVPDANGEVHDVESLRAGRSEMPRPGYDLASRFQRKVQPARDLSPNGMSGCLLWIGALERQGYGQIWNGNRLIMAHRAAWLLAGRVIPASYELDHLCRRRNCVNGDHLEAVSSAENSRRGACAKITRAQADEIRLLRSARWRIVDIAPAYGISIAAVKRVVARTAWTDD